jgi:hypothetical protein
VSPRWCEQQVDDESGPARLVHGPEAGAIVALEVLVAPEQPLPGRIGLEQLDAEQRPSLIGTRQPDRDGPFGEIDYDLERLRS